MVILFSFAIFTITFLFILSNEAHDRMRHKCMAHTTAIDRRDEVEIKTHQNVKYFIGVRADYTHLKLKWALIYALV